MDSIHYSSDKMDWCTPDSIFDPLNEEFRFELDVACTVDNSLCPHGIAIDEGYSGLTEDWAGWVTPSPAICWMNPPYGRELSKWVQKAWDEKRNGCTTVCLIPARTDTKWWAIFWDHEKHRLRTDQWPKLQPHDEVRFIKGRIKFKGAKHAAPFPSAIVVLRGLDTPRSVVEDSTSYTSAALPHRLHKGLLNYE